MSPMLPSEATAALMAAARGGPLARRRAKALPKPPTRIEAALEYVARADEILAQIPDRDDPRGERQDARDERALEREVRRTIRSEERFVKWKKLRETTRASRKEWRAALKKSRDSQAKYAKALKRQKKLNKAAKNPHLTKEQKQNLRVDAVEGLKNAGNQAAADADAERKAHEKHLNDLFRDQEAAYEGHVSCGDDAVRWCLGKSARHTKCQEIPCEDDKCVCSLFNENGSSWNPELESKIRAKQKADAAKQKAKKQRGKQKGARGVGGAMAAGAAGAAAGAGAPGGEVSRAKDERVVMPPTGIEKKITKPRVPRMPDDSLPTGTQAETACLTCEQALALIKSQGEATNSVQRESQIKCLWSAASNPQNPLTSGLDKNDSDRRGLLIDLLSLCSTAVTQRRAYAAPEDSEVPKIPGDGLGSTPGAQGYGSGDVFAGEEMDSPELNCPHCEAALVNITVGGNSLANKYRCLYEATQKTVGLDADWLGATLRKDFPGGFDPGGPLHQNMPPPDRLAAHEIGPAVETLKRLCRAYLRGPPAIPTRPRPRRKKKNPVKPPPMLNVRPNIKYSGTITKTAEFVNRRARWYRLRLPEVVLDCPDSVTIFVHGIENDLREATENTNRIASLLRNAGYRDPVIGFAWNGDPGLIHYEASEEAATLSGRLLAIIILRIRTRCEATRINVVAHSLGSRVALAALQNGARVDSLQMFSAAVPNDVFEEEGDFSAKTIGSRGGSIHVYYMPEDDAMAWYRRRKRAQPLGRHGVKSLDDIKGLDVSQTDYTRFLLLSSPGGKGKSNNPDEPSMDAEDDHSGAFYSAQMGRQFASRLR